MKKNMLRFDIILTFLFWSILIIIFGWFMLVLGWYIMKSFFFFDIYIPSIIEITFRILKWTLVFALCTFIVGRVGLFFNDRHLKKRKTNHWALPTNSMATVNQAIPFFQQSNPLKANMMMYKKQQAQQDRHAAASLSAAMKFVKNKQLTKAASLFRIIIELPDAPDLIKKIAKLQLSDTLEALSHKKMSTMVRESSL